MSGPGPVSPSIGVIGCGAIAASIHVPALARRAEVRERVVLIDPDEERARQLAALHGIERTEGDLAACLNELDGAIICAPHNLHFTLARDCLEAGLHVLCEKPLAETGEEARRLIELAQVHGRALCVNHTRRLYPSSAKVRELIADGGLGTLRSIRYTWGEKFGWPAATGGYFGLASGGRGVLFDKGVHLLDLVCWWLGGRPRLVSYRDDSLGGSEAVAEVQLEHRDCRVEVRLSWLSRYDNRFRVEGESGSLEGELYDWRTVTVVRASGERKMLRLESPARDAEDLARRMVENFVAVVRGDESPLVPARDVIDSIELIDECYASRQRFEMPWYDTLDRLRAV